MLWKVQEKVISCTFVYLLFLQHFAKRHLYVVHGNPVFIYHLVCVHEHEYVESPVLQRQYCHCLHGVLMASKSYWTLCLWHSSNQIGNFQKIETLSHQTSFYFLLYSHPLDRTWKLSIVNYCLLPIRQPGVAWAMSKNPHLTVCAALLNITCQWWLVIMIARVFKSAAKPCRW